MLTPELYDGSSTPALAYSPCNLRWARMDPFEPALQVGL